MNYYAPQNWNHSSLRQYILEFRTVLSFRWITPQTLPCASGLIEDNWIIFLFSWQLDSYILLLHSDLHFDMLSWLKYRKTVWPHRYIVEREGLIISSDNCGYSSLILNQNLTSGSFLKASCNVESKTLSIHFSYSFFPSLFLLLY